MSDVATEGGKLSIRSRMRWLQRALRPIQRARQLGCCMTAGMGCENVEVRLTETAGGRPRAYYRGLHRCGSPWSCPTCRQRAMIVRGQDVAAAMTGHGAEQCLLLTGTVRHTRHDDLELNQRVIKLALSKFQQGVPWKRGRVKLGWKHHVATWEHTWSAANGWHPHFHGIVFCDRLGVPELDRPDPRVYGYKARRRGGDGDWVYYGLGTARCSAIAQALADDAGLKDADGFVRPVSEWAVAASWLDWARSRWVESVRRAVVFLGKSIAPEKRDAWVAEKLAHYLPTHEVGLTFERCYSDRVKEYLLKMGISFVVDENGGGDDATVLRQFEGAGARKLGLDGAALADVGTTRLPSEVRLGLEIADVGHKQGRGDSLTPLQIAWQFALASQKVTAMLRAGELDAGGREGLADARLRYAEFRGLWQEYCRVTEGLRHMTWSAGARVALGLAKPDGDEDGVSDEGIAKNEDVESQSEDADAEKPEKPVIAMIPRCLYADLVRSGADDRVLQRAEEQPGVPGLRGVELVAYARSLVYQQEPDTPPVYAVPDELGHGPVCLGRPRAPSVRKGRPVKSTAQRGFRFA